MANRKAQGANFFSIDCDLDDCMQAIIDIHGNDGMAFVIRIKQAAFKRDDAEAQAGNESLLKGLAARVMVTPERLNEIIETSFDVGYLDREAFKSRGVLTSAAFKDEMSRITSERNRKRGGTSGKTPGTSRDDEGNGEELPSPSLETPKNGGECAPLAAECSPSPSDLKDLEGGAGETKRFEISLSTRAALTRQVGEPCVSFYVRHCNDFLRSHRRGVDDFDSYVRKFIREDKAAKKNFFHPNYEPPRGRP